MRIPSQTPKVALETRYTTHQPYKQRLNLSQRLLCQDSPSIHLPRSHAIRFTALCNALPAGQTSETEVWLAPKATKDISHVVFRFDTVFESLVPVVDDAFDDLNACIEDVGYRNTEAVLLGGCEML